MIDWNKPIEYLDGGVTRPARLVCSDRKYSELSHLILVDYENGIPEQHLWVTAKGVFYGVDRVRNKKEKKTHWVALYTPRSSNSLGPYTHSAKTKEEVERNCPGLGTVLKIFEVEYEI